MNTSISLNRFKPIDISPSELSLGENCGARGWPHLFVTFFSAPSSALACTKLGWLPFLFHSKKNYIRKLHAYGTYMMYWLCGIVKFSNQKSRPGYIEAQEQLPASFKGSVPNGYHWLRHSDSDLPQKHKHAPNKQNTGGQLWNYAFGKNMPSHI